MSPVRAGHWEGTREVLEAPFRVIRQKRGNMCHYYFFIAVVLKGFPGDWDHIRLSSDKMLQTPLKISSIKEVYTICLKAEEEGKMRATVMKSQSVASA